MTNELPAWIALVIVTISAVGLFLSQDWRWGLAFMAIQYMGAATLTWVHWPVGMSAAFLVAGWMSTALIGMTLTSAPRLDEPAERVWPQGRLFRAFMAGIVFVLAATFSPRVDSLVAGVGIPVIAGTILVTGLGLLQLGSTIQIPRVILGLLSVLAGFEIFYASVESSILVAGLLAVVTLGLGLTGSYLLGTFLPEEAE
jgi:hypothetical protein